MRGTLAVWLLLVVANLACVMAVQCRYVRLTITSARSEDIQGPVGSPMLRLIQQKGIVPISCKLKNEAECTPESCGNCAASSCAEGVEGQHCATCAFEGCKDSYYWSDFDALGQDGGKVTLSIDLLHAHDLLGYVIAAQKDESADSLMHEQHSKQQPSFRAPVSWTLKCSLDNKMFWNVDQRTMSRQRTWSPDQNVILPLGTGTSLRNVWEAIVAPSLCRTRNLVNCNGRALSVSDLPAMTNTALYKLALTTLKTGTLDGDIRT